MIRFLAAMTILSGPLSASALAAELSPVKPADVTKIFAAQYATVCDTLDAGATAPEPTVYRMKFRYDWDQGADPTPLTLYQFPCVQAAYNDGDVYYAVNEYNEIHALQFAVPVLDIAYADPGNSDSAVKSISIAGYSTMEIVFQPIVDAKAGTIDHFMKWRGLGDANESGEWVLRNGTFMLSRFTVDASYDGKHDPVIVYPPKK